MSHCFTRYYTEKSKGVTRFFMLCLLLPVLLSSCLGGDDDNIDPYGDMAITGVTLGTLNRYVEALSAQTGNDTIVKSTLTGSAYKLTIDQLSHTIYNLDSLPVGTDLKHVVISSLTTKNNGVVYMKSLTSDTLRYVNNTDSLDFSQPRILRVFATDGSGSRDYTMTLSASTHIGINFGWKRVATSEQLEGWDDAQLVVVGDTIALVERGTVAKDGLLYRVAEGTVERSTNFQDWTVVAEGTGLRTLIGAATRELYALGDDGRLKASADNGATWHDENLDSDASLLPAEGISCTTWEYTPSDSTDYVLMTGPSQTNENEMVVWRKITSSAALTSDSDEREGKWVYMTVDDSSRYSLPRQECVSMAVYDGTVLAVGSNMKILQSRDQGISWKYVSAYAMPSYMQGARVCMTSDSMGHLWLVTNAGEVWQGTLR